jgi:hypothetical protein
MDQPYAIRRSAVLSIEVRGGARRRQRASRADAASNPAETIRMIRDPDTLHASIDKLRIRDRTSRIWQPVFACRMMREARR